MTDISYDSHKSPDNLLTTLINAAKSHGLGLHIAEDIQRDPTTYRQLLQKIFILQQSQLVFLMRKSLNYLIPE